MSSKTDKMPLLQDKVLAGVRRLRMFPPGARVLVGVSGGPDSMVLLHVLNSLKHVLGIRLKAVHFDHKLRADSARDAEHVRAESARWGVPFLLGSSRKPYPSSGSLEELARKRRYDFFIRAARQWKADGVALAHSRDDQAETVLMRVLRGTGTTGLRAILPVRSIQGVLFVRPLLDIPRAEIEAYLGLHRIGACKDPSNLSMDFFRNLVRCRIIPFLESASGLEVRSHLAALAGLAAREYDFMERALDKVAESRLSRAGSALRISCKGWARLHPALSSLLIRRAFALVKGDMNALTLHHVAAVEQLIAAGMAGARVDLPGGMIAGKSSDACLVITRKST